MEDITGYGDEFQFPCCGKMISYVDWDEAHARPEDGETYCYEAQNWGREILVMRRRSRRVYWMKGARYGKTWWREWKKAKGSEAQLVVCEVENVGDMCFRRSRYTT